MTNYKLKIANKRHNTKLSRAVATGGRREETREYKKYIIPEIE